MKDTSIKKDIMYEEGCTEPVQERPPKIVYKIMFFTFGILSALTICILIRLSNNLTAEKRRHALRRFEEIANHVIEQQSHPK